ncbi:MAG: CBS domain-containing protein [Elusimicrobia bacterium]|nr:CBS domain-containing protein [Elusimicrobiota bacterium]
MKVRELMSGPVESVEPGDTVFEAARRMRSFDVGVLPVRDAGGLAGVLTDRDIVVRVVAEGGDPRQIDVREVMTRRPVACYVDQDVRDAARLMERSRVRRLPVLDYQDRLVGVLSLGDLPKKAEGLRVAAEVLEAVAAK